MLQYDKLNKNAKAAYILKDPISHMVDYLLLYSSHPNITNGCYLGDQFMGLYR